MGMAKRPHIAALCALPRVRAAWATRHGGAPTEADIDALYDVFVPKNVAVAAAYADAIPGVADTLAALRRAGDQDRLLDRLHARNHGEDPAARGGAGDFAPDSLVCTGDTPEGRPSPLMFWRGLIELDVWPAWRAVKVDDTTVGVAEGVNAGAWSIGVAVSGNVFGASLEEARAMAAGGIRPPPRRRLPGVDARPGRITWWIRRRS